MLLLALDTATPAVTVALHDGGRVLAETTVIDARRHGELLTPVIHRVLVEAAATPAALTAVAVGTGPGPYTGLRVGVMTARALGAALGVPVYGLCTLDAIAYDAVRIAAAAATHREVPAAGPPGLAPGQDEPGGCRGTAGMPGPFLVATDARRKEVYWAAYAADGRRASGPAVSRPADLPPGRPAAGYGAWLYPQAFGRLLEPRYPAASALAALAARALATGTKLAGPVPLYLRLPDARLPGPPKAVSHR